MKNTTIKKDIHKCSNFCKTKWSDTSEDLKSDAPKGHNSNQH